MTIWYNMLQYDYIWWYFEIHDPWANRTSWWHLCSSVAFLCLAQNSHRSCHSFRTISTLDTLQRDTKRINHVRSLISQITVTLGQTTCTACTSSICKTLQNCLAGIGNGSFSSVPTQLLRLQHLTPKSWVKFPTTIVDSKFKQMVRQKLSLWMLRFKMVVIQVVKLAKGQEFVLDG